MSVFYQLWNDETHNLIDEFDTETEALDEVRWRFAVDGERAVRQLSLLRATGANTIEAIALGDELIQRLQEAHPPRVAAD